MQQDHSLISEPFPFSSGEKLDKPIYAFRPYTINCISSSSDPKCDDIPLARSGHRIVADNKGNLYCFGGYSSEVNVLDENRDDYIWMENCLLFKELWKFNIATRTWAKIKTNGVMPEELASYSAVLVSNKLLVYGGTSLPFGQSSSNTVHICDLETLTWSKVEASGDLPIPQYGQAIIVDETNLYVVGGTTGFDYSMGVHCLNLRTKEWTEMKTNIEPQPRYRHEIVLDDNRLLVFGGGTASKSYALKEIPSFDLKQNMWKILDTSSRKSEHPEARRCHGCVKLGDDVYISGGHAPGKIFSDIWTINLRSFIWKKLPCNLLLPVYFHSAAVSPEGQMFIFGGVTSMENNRRTNKMFNLWVKIPTLTEICWQAFLYYVPHITDFSKYELLQTGIPIKYVNQVALKSRFSK